MTPVDRKLCVFDFDSTLMDGETIDMLAEAYGQGPEVRAITEQAMHGELDFFQALTKRAGLLKGMRYEEAVHICHTLPLMPGAKETVAALKACGFNVVIFSGGFREATCYWAGQLGADADFANFLHQQNGMLTGHVGGEMMVGEAKGNLLGRLQHLLQVSPEKTVVVGDGANDLSMFPYSSHHKIAFCAKPVLRQAADYQIDTKDLRELLPFVDTF